MRKIYKTDGSPEGFFTAVFDVFAEKKKEIAEIISCSDFQTEFFDEYKKVSPDSEKATRVVNKLRLIDKRSLYEIDYMLRTPAFDREQTAFLYIRRLLQYEKPVREMLGFPEIRRAMDLVRQVSFEAERMRGFLRFHETETGIFYSACTPDNDLIDLLAEHFCARFRRTPFVIHDVRKQKAAIYNGSSYIVVPAAKADVLYSEDEDVFLNLWKQYYNAVTIVERKNTRQMKRYMPVRYWKFLPEKEL